jgi:hypothetical protein
MKGEAATLPPAGSSKIDLSFSEILDELDIGIMGMFEARKGKFALWSDVFYSRISTSVDTPGPFYDGADYEQKLGYTSFGVSYRVVENEWLELDALAGVRFFFLDNEMDLNGGILPAENSQYDENWYDPFLSVKTNVALTEKLYFTGWAGMAVGGESESSYDFFGGLGYKFSETYSAVAGYRHLEVDYEQGDFLFGVEMSGLLLGLVIRF